VRLPLRQWMLRITAYADRLQRDLDDLDWHEGIKALQRNWIGRSTGAEVYFPLPDVENILIRDESDAIESMFINTEVRVEESLSIYTTRPDTLFGATYMVIAPEHPLIDRLTKVEQAESVKAYRELAARKSDLERTELSKEKTGVFTGSYAINPVNEERIPIWVADYVLASYGTGAIMAVPAHDERDFEFARQFGLPIKAVVDPGEAVAGEERAEILAGERVYSGDGVAVNSGQFNGLATADFKRQIIADLETREVGREAVNYKLRDWLFSRQRFWGEPFPILHELDAAGKPTGRVRAVPEDQLPVDLPHLEDFKPHGRPEPPLDKAPEEWLYPVIDGKRYKRETNTMPQWAGSCWYYLRFLDPKNDKAPIDPAVEKAWMPVDLYIGGAEHAVLHLLYARFWHKVLFDLGVVSTAEPFQKLVNQGLILGETEYHFFEQPGGAPISASDIKDIAEEATAEGPKLFGIHRTTGAKHFATRVIEPLVEKKGDRYVLKANANIAVDARSFKMSKSRGNVVNPDDIVGEYGADCFRLYEMYMGPLEAQKPWNTRDIVGMWRFLKSVWRNIIGDDPEGAAPSTSGHRVAEVETPDALDRMMHRTIRKVGEDIELLRFNTAIAELIKLNNEMGRLEQVPRKLAETYAVLLSPFAPHVAEEIWARLGHAPSIQSVTWPVFDAAKLVESTMELPVQVNGKLRDKLSVPTDASEADIFAAVEASDKVQPWIAGKQVKKRLYVPKKLVNYVVADA
jgi:leucyl-tRNA synthetase